eukprot:scaffold5872_cov104-Isochrysis_galbana.AAC.6
MAKSAMPGAERVRVPASRSSVGRRRARRGCEVERSSTPDGPATPHSRSQSNRPVWRSTGHRRTRIPPHDLIGCTAGSPPNRAHAACDARTAVFGARSAPSSLAAVAVRAARSAGPSTNVRSMKATRCSTSSQIESLPSEARTSPVGRPPIKSSWSPHCLPAATARKTSASLILRSA